MKPVVIAGYTRSPFTFAHKGALATKRPDDLAADVVRGLVDRSGVDPALIEDLILGCAFPEGEQGFNMARLVGLMAGVAQYAMTAAFRIAPSSTLAPFEYTGVVWAVVLGFVIWGEWPSRDVWIGATVIVFSGLYIVYRERLAAQRRRTAAA